MSALRALRRDHDDIETMLAVFAAAVSRLEQGRYVDPEMLAGILRFFRQFVGECHDAKEETGLFPLITASGRETELVSALIAEHATHRAIIAALSGPAAIGGLADGLRQLPGMDTSAPDTFIARARAYVASVRDHVRREDRFFQDVVATRLTLARHKELLDAFNGIERATIGPTGREWYTQMIDDYRDIVSTWGHWPTAR